MEEYRKSKEMTISSDSPKTKLENSESTEEQNHIIIEVPKNTENNS